MKTRIGQFARSVSIIGIGVTPLGNVQASPELKDMTERELFAWACMEAMEDAGLEAKEIDCLYVGHVFSESHSGQISTSGMFSRWIGMNEKPGFRHETACCTAVSGLRHAVLAVASGMHDIVISGCVDINLSNAMVGLPPFHRTPAIFEDVLYDSNALGCDQAYWYPGGEIMAFLEGAYIAYGKKYGYSLDQLIDAISKCAINSRHNAMNNPLALLVNETMEDEAKKFGFDDPMKYLKSKYNPLIGAIQGFKHTTGVADGASALIVCPTELAKKLVKDRPVAEVLGLGMTTSSGYQQAGSPMSFDLESFSQSLTQAGIKDPYKEIDYMGIHDCCAQHYMTVTEAAGYFKPGEGLHAVMEGRIAPDGDKPVNTSGGRLNLGHPIAGAAGYEIAEAVWQMQGKCGLRQMKKPPETVLIHGLGAGFHVASAVLRAI